MIHKNPYISIITVSFNSAKTIEETILSVITQDYDNLQYIIIDGGSTDGTLDIIGKYKCKIPIVISEPDIGISDAFNKGIKNSSGDIIGLINSDDVLLQGALNTVARNYDDSIDIYRGKILLWDDINDFQYSETPTMHFGKIPFFVHVCHPATFVKKSCYEKYGDFKVNYKYMMDLELLRRFYKRGVTFKFIDKELVKFRMGGITGDTERIKTHEREQLIKDYGGNQFDIFIYITYLMAIELGKKVINLFGDEVGYKLRYKNGNKLK